MYHVAIFKEWTIPEVARKTGKSEAWLRELFEKAKEKDEICTFEMPGDPPPIWQDR